MLGITLNLYVAFGRITILTILILWVYEHRQSFHLLGSFSVSFFNVFNFFLFKSFICLIRVITGYYFLFIYCLIEDIVILGKCVGCRLLVEDKFVG